MRPKMLRDEAPVARGKNGGMELLHHSMMQSGFSRIGVRGALDKNDQTAAQAVKQMSPSY
jgi:hypothetical protein